MATHGNIWHSVQTLREDAGLNGVLVGGYVDIHRVSFWYKSFHATSGTLQFRVLGEIDDNYPNNLGDFFFVEEVFNPPIRFTHPTFYIIVISQWDGLSGAQYVDNVTIDFDANVS